jgi:hypothetical protein
MGLRSRVAAEFFHSGGVLLGGRFCGVRATLEPGVESVLQPAQEGVDAVHVLAFRPVAQISGQHFSGIVTKGGLDFGEGFWRDARWLVGWHEASKHPPFFALVQAETVEGLELFHRRPQIVLDL